MHQSSKTDESKIKALEQQIRSLDVGKNSQNILNIQNQLTEIKNQVQIQGGGENTLSQ